MELVMQSIEDVVQDILLQVTFSLFTSQLNTLYSKWPKVEGPEMASRGLATPSVVGRSVA